MDVKAVGFFPMRAHAWAQVHLQRYYYWMMVLFTILVTAVGNNPAVVLEQIAEAPFSIFRLLAYSLPQASNFYVNWITCQWVPVFMDLSRYQVLTKYMLFSKAYEQGTRAMHASMACKRGT